MSNTKLEEITELVKAVPDNKVELLTGYAQGLIDGQKEDK